MRVALGVLRLLVLVSLGAVWLFEKAIDHQIEALWSWLRIQAWYRVRLSPLHTSQLAGAQKVLGRLPTLKPSLSPCMGSSSRTFCTVSFHHHPYRALSTP